MAKFKVTFTLDESDAEYFRDLYRKASQRAGEHDSETIIVEARSVVSRVRSSGKAPAFVIDAISVLADLADLVQDDEYAAPVEVRQQVLGGIAYFANPQDLIPDHVPGLGFLDDAIMVKLIEQEFKHELWGYRRFRKRRDSVEQRPWSSVARERLDRRLDADRRRIRAEIQQREAREATRRRAPSYLGW